MNPKNESKREQTFYVKLQTQTDKFTKSDHLIICGDLNAGAGTLPIAHVVGPTGEDRTNEDGHELRQSATCNKLQMTNTLFRMKNIYKYTWGN